MRSSGRTSSLFVRSLTRALIVAAFVVCFVYPPAGGSATSGLVAAYSFDEGTGTTVADASGNGNTGTTASTTWAAGKYGNALAFNGSTSRVTIPSVASLQLTSAMTLEAWVRPVNAASDWRDVVYKGDDNYYMMATTTPKGYPAGGGIIGGSYGEVFGTAKLSTTAWTHLALTYDGATERFYVN